MQNDKMKKENFLEEWRGLKKKKIEEVGEKELRRLNEQVMEVELNNIKPMPYAGNFNSEEDEIVEYKYPELVALCPMTGILDIYHVTIRFIPDQKVSELKSLKFYFLDYKDLPISHENLAAKIYHEFKEAVEPEKIHVSLSVNVRGGIGTDIVIGDEIEEVGRKRALQLRNDSRKLSE